MNPLSDPLPDSIDASFGVIDSVLGQLSRRLPAHVSREDLASAGKLALIAAARRATTHDGAAHPARIRGAMLDELRRLDPLSRLGRSRVNAVRRATASLEARLGRTPTPVERAEAAGLTPDELQQVESLALASDPCSVHETDEHGEPRIHLVDRDAVCPALSAEFGDLSATLHEALDRLTPNQAHVLRRYYLDDATLEEIAGELNVTKERVRQIREAGSRRLRSDLMVLALWDSFVKRAPEV